MSTTTLTQGIEEYESTITFGTGITGTGLLHSFGTRKIQTFVGSLAATDTDTAYADGDVLVELGTLDINAPSSIVTPTKFYIHRALVGITTAAGQTLVGGLSLSATSGTATNSGVSSGTEIVGAGVASFNPRISATDAVTEVDINYGNTAGLYHIFNPNINAAIASKYLYAFTTTTLNADASAGRFTVELEYSVY
jgi:hypothetical protein|tara:strand:- start:226 stop:810 length:585 start_codon:yes stop_codon:yes gene_type:complete